jgi:2-succinyl-6-hydroxy-2,4-cyclohexadiene-1-carboxylate synthase
MMPGSVESQLVLLHGFTHTGASWEPVVGALGERYRASAPDIRGHGSASVRRPVDLAGVLDDLAAVAPEEFVLAGYSMGGRLALQLSLARPRGINRLILIGASPGLADPSERQARRVADEALAAELEDMTIEEFARGWARTPVLAGLPDEVAERVHQDRLRNTTTGLAAALRGLGPAALPPVWDRLDELTMPVTLVVGERDQKFRGVAGEMAGLIPQAEVAVVSDTGHAVHLEAPERVAQIIAGAPGVGRR